VSSQVNRTTKRGFTGVAESEGRKEKKKKNRKRRKNGGIRKYTYVQMQFTVRKLGVDIRLKDVRNTCYLYIICNVEKNSVEQVHRKRRSGTSAGAK